MEKLYTVNEACKILRVSRPTLMKMLHRGLIPGAYQQHSTRGKHIGNGNGIPWKIPESGLLAYQQNNVVQMGNLVDES